MGKMFRHKCAICGSTFYSSSPVALYCPECEYELRRVRLADEETVEEWLERMYEENSAPAKNHKGKILPLTHFE